MVGIDRRLIHGVEDCPGVNRSAGAQPHDGVKFLRHDALLGILEVHVPCHQGNVSIDHPPDAFLHPDRNPHRCVVAGEDPREVHVVATFHGPRRHFLWDVRRARVLDMPVPIPQCGLDEDQPPASIEAGLTLHEPVLVGFVPHGLARDGVHPYALAVFPVEQEFPFHLGLDLAVGSDLGSDGDQGVVSDTPRLDDHAGELRPQLDRLGRQVAGRRRRGRLLDHRRGRRRGLVPAGTPDQDQGNEKQRNHEKVLSVHIPSLGLPTHYEPDKVVYHIY